MNEKEPNECVIVAWIESKTTCTAVMQINQFIHEQKNIGMCSQRRPRTGVFEDCSMRCSG